jgi:hypothetical protein
MGAFSKVPIALAALSSLARGVEFRRSNKDDDKSCFLQNLPLDITSDKILFENEQGDFAVCANFDVTCHYEACCYFTDCPVFDTEYQFNDYRLSEIHLDDPNIHHSYFNNLNFTVSSTESDQSTSKYFTLEELEELEKEHLSDERFCSASDEDSKNFCKGATNRNRHRLKRDAESFNPKITSIDVGKIRQGAKTKVYFNGQNLLNHVEITAFNTNPLIKIYFTVEKYDNSDEVHAEFPEDFSLACDFEENSQAYLWSEESIACNLNPPEIPSGSEYTMRLHVEYLSENGESYVDIKAFGRQNGNYKALCYGYDDCKLKASQTMWHLPYIEYIGNKGVPGVGKMLTWTEWSSDYSPGFRKGGKVCDFPVKSEVRRISDKKPLDEIVDDGKNGDEEIDGELKFANPTTV